MSHGVDESEHGEGLDIGVLELVELIRYDGEEERDAQE